MKTLVVAYVLLIGVVSPEMISEGSSLGFEARGFTSKEKCEDFAKWKKSEPGSLIYYAKCIKFDFEDERK